MKKSKLPTTDSIKELAKFCDNHDLTDFEDALQKVSEPVFVHATSVKVPLKKTEAAVLQRMAQAKGISREELVRGWVLQKLSGRDNCRGTR